MLMWLLTCVDYLMPKRGNPFEVESILSINRTKNILKMPKETYKKTPTSFQYVKEQGSQLLFLQAETDDEEESKAKQVAKWNM